jgi:acetyltransferase-like isoleucine patch superfamily enzyme
MAPDSDFSGVNSRAIVAPWVVLGPGVKIHPFAIVGRLPDESAALARRPSRIRELHIGAGTVVGPHAVIYGGSTIGENCLIGDFASVREGCRIGDRVVVGRYAAIGYDCEIADDVRFQDQTNLVGGSRVGTGCFFGIGVVTSNDRRVDLADYHYPGASAPQFGERVMVGSGANIVAGVHIGDGALIAAGAVIVDDVPAGHVMMGTPAVRRLAPAG